MQLFAAPRTLPMLGAPIAISWCINSNGLLALAPCALHESDAQLVPSWLPRPLPATIGVSQHPLRQLLATPTKNPAVHLRLLEAQGCRLFHSLLNDLLPTSGTGRCCCICRITSVMPLRMLTDTAKMILS